MIRETVPSREAALEGRLALINTGSAGPAKIEVYGGTKPTSVNDAPGTPLLVAIELENPAGVIDAGALELLAVEPGLIMSSGTATWARVTNRAEATCFDMDAGDTLSSAECKLSQTELFAGGLVSLVSAILG